MLVERLIFSQILLWLGERKILIIRGARQTGKTVLLHQLEKNVRERNEAAVYFAVDEDVDNPIFSDAKLFLKFLSAQHPVAAGRKLFVFLDEFQYLKNAGRFLKIIFDRAADALQLIVSGSSSLEIGEQTEFLTGRKIEFLLRPFSFREFLSARSAIRYPATVPVADSRALAELYALYRADLEQQFTEFVNWGGYPEPTLTPDQSKRQAILKEIFKTYIQKDVALFLHVENISGFNKMVKIAAGQIGNLVNRDELAGTLGLNKETVRKYLEILQGTFIFSLVRPYFTNLRRELSKMPKIFANDLGSVKVVLDQPATPEYGSLSGAAVENVVFTELLQKIAAEHVYFYRTLAKAEIDFIVATQGGLWPIEVKFRRAVARAPAIVKHFRRQYRERARPALVVTQNDLRFEPEAIFLPAPLMTFVNLE